MFSTLSDAQCDGLSYILTLTQVTYSFGIKEGGYGAEKKTWRTQNTPKQAQAKRQSVVVLLDLRRTWLYNKTKKKSMINSRYARL